MTELGFIFTTKGDFMNSLNFLEAMERRDYLKILDDMGREGVSALAAVTPKDTGTTASSWDYKVTIGDDYSQIAWINSNRNKDFEIAIGLQHGHGTGTGGYVRGIDYINPAMRKIFEDIVTKMWKVVTNS